ncbi:MAG: 4Fe-4S dicluster domain-containing protein [Ignavibacteria bacterium]|nr:4Fe-4S dicluster domain-containing protein [Ignavibacteria bacterium]
MDRRNFLKTAAAISVALPNGKTKAENQNVEKEFYGVLVDTTRCIGCRSCEVACSLEHNLFVPDITKDNAFNSIRDTSEKQWTVVNCYDTAKGKVYVKKQCMHCWQPACSAACLTNAMFKTTDGPVIWRENKCMGCRYCMVSCPFDIPKFEYHEWNPKIQKCKMCYERIIDGKKPACVDACPMDALMFGSKRELLEIARYRVYSHPEKYEPKIYGEYEVGGTGWLYLSPVPFDQIGFRTDLGNTPYPEYTREFLYAVPLVLFGVPALLLGLNMLTERKNEIGKTEELNHE